MSYRGRLLAEFRDVMKNKDPLIRFDPNVDDLHKWTAYIKGPEKTPYENHIFQLFIECPQDFPIHPPTVKFRTQIFHPNIDFSSGDVCADILKNAWTPIWTLTHLCQAIISLLGDPNADSPLNCDAGNLLRQGDIIGYQSMAKMYAVENALRDFPV